MPLLFKNPQQRPNRGPGRRILHRVKHGADRSFAEREDGVHDLAFTPTQAGRVVILTAHEFSETIGNRLGNVTVKILAVCRKAVKTGRLNF
jgi:hypothetical protein